MRGSLSRAGDKQNLKKTERSISIIETPLNGLHSNREATNTHVILNCKVKNYASNFGLMFKNAFPGLGRKRESYNGGLYYPITKKVSSTLILSKF